RYDHIPEVALRRSSGREVVETIREDRVDEVQGGVFLENTTHFSSWFRGFIGLRADLIHVDVDSDTPENSGDDSDAQVSPKAGIVITPLENVELYLNGGFGFHSNDARG